MYSGGQVRYAPQPSQQDIAVTADSQELGVYEPKIAEQLNLRGQGSLLNMLARNFKTIEKITLYLAFFINVILLFHRVDIIRGQLPSHSKTGGDEGAGIEGDEQQQQQQEEEEDVLEAIYITGMTLPYFSYEITGWILAQVNEYLLCTHNFVISD
jgi:hypothetical protein